MISVLCRTSKLLKQLSWLPRVYPCLLPESIWTPINVRFVSQMKRPISQSYSYMMLKCQIHWTVDIIAEVCSIRFVFSTCSGLQFLIARTWTLFWTPKLQYLENEECFDRIKLLYAILPEIFTPHSIISWYNSVITVTAHWYPFLTFVKTLFGSCRYTSVGMREWDCCTPLVCTAV